MSNPHTIRKRNHNMRAEWGERLRAQRIERGITQDVLAERVGVTRQAVSSWERGIATPSADARRAIAKALRTTIKNVFPAPAAA